MHYNSIPLKYSRAARHSSREEVSKNLAVNYERRVKYTFCQVSRYLARNVRVNNVLPTNFWVIGSDLD